MISFNDLKNNIQIAKNYLKQMGFFNQKDSIIKPNSLDQEFFRKNFPQILLQILHFVIIEYSSDLFMQILEICPTIRTDNDMPFIEHSLIISRNLLKVDVKIDAGQFFNQNKFFQKKIQLVSKVCKAVYEFQNSQQKGNNSNNFGISKSKPQLKNDSKNNNFKVKKPYIDEDDDQDMPRSINVVPTSKNQQISSFCPPSNMNGLNKYINQDQNNSDSDQQLKLLRERKNKVQNTIQPKQKQRKQAQSQRERQIYRIQANDKKTVPRLNRNIELTKQAPKNTNSSMNSNSQNSMSTNNNINKNLIVSGNVHFDSQKQKHHHQEEEQSDQQTEEYMTKKEMLQIMSALNANISNLTSNFANFQKDVSIWMNNINAKVSILQENVKTIRNNL